MHAVGAVREILVVGESGQTKDRVIAALARELESSGHSVRVENQVAKDLAPIEAAWRAGAAPDPDLALAMVRAHLGNRQYVRNVAHAAAADSVVIYDGGPVSILADFPRDEARKLLSRAYNFPGNGVVPELLLNTYSAVAYIDTGARDRDLYLRNGRASVLAPGADLPGFAREVASRAAAAEPVDPAKFRFHEVLDHEGGGSEGIESVVVFTSAKNPGAVYEEALELLGRAIALREWTLVTGGDGVGCMRLVNVGYREVGGPRRLCISTHGIDEMAGTPSDERTIFIKSVHDRLAARARALELLEEYGYAKIVAREMFERNLLFENNSDAALWTPGGIGSLLESGHWMQYNQKGYQAKPLGILDINHSHRSALRFLQEMTETGFAFPSDFDRFNVTVPYEYKSRGKHSRRVAVRSIERYLDAVADVDKRLRAAAGGVKLG
jgi:predicted Rossmann-fold nucleotide-binding protein